MKYSSRFFLYAPLAVFLALAAGVAVHWWILASAFDRKLAALNGREIAPHIVLRYGTKAISGFPFRIDAVFTNFTISAAAPHGEALWHSDAFALHTLTYGRAQYIFEASGNQALNWTDGENKIHHLHFLPGSLRASAIADEKGLSRFDLDIIDASGKDTDGSAFAAGRVQAHLRRDPKGDALDLMLSADAVKNSRAITPLFGDRIRKLRLYATLTQGAAFAPLFAGHSSWPDAAAMWRAKHGSVMLGNVEIASAGLNVEAKGFDIEGGLGALLNPLY